MGDNIPLNAWMKDWEALQRQYLNAWADFSGKAPLSPSPFAGMNPAAMPFPGFNPTGAFAGFPGAGAFGGGMPSGWQDGLDQWTRAFADGGRQTETTERLVESAKSYLAMIQAMFGAASMQQSLGAGATNPAQAWFESLRNGFGAPSGLAIPGLDAAMQNNPFAKALRDVTGQGATGFAQLPATWAPMLEQMRAEGLSWLRIPAFGVGREHQEHYQKTAQAFADYQQALHNYNLLMLKAGQRGYERFESKLAAHEEPGRAIDSVRGLYDLWVDAVEEAYAEIALSEEFSKVYGELANAQMRARAQVQAEVERVSTDLGMPTRSELNSIGQRVHDLRRELRERRESTDNEALAAQVAQLQTEVAALKETVAGLRKRPGSAQREASAAVVAPVVAKAAESVVEKIKPARVEATAVAKKKASRVRKARARPPLPVVRPKPAGETTAKKASRKEKSSFDDAIAAMRRRVVDRPGKLKAVGATVTRAIKRGSAGNPKKARSGKRASRSK